VYYFYNAQERVIRQDRRTVDIPNFISINYGYDSAGRLSTLAMLSTQLTYTYDAAGRIGQIDTTNNGITQNLVSGITYQPFGAPKSWAYGNGQTYSRGFDLDGRISGFTLSGAAQTLSFDAASRITGATYFPNPAQSVTYGYDNLDRLTSTVTPSTNYTFTYDANGNRTSKTVGAVTKTYTYPTTNNKLSSVTGGGSWTYTHDANGSVTGDGTNTFTYDAKGRLTGGQTALGAVTYKVNGLGQRYAKTLGGVTTNYFYDQFGRLLAETSDGGATFIGYMWLNDTLVAWTMYNYPTPDRYYVHPDHLNTPRVLTDQNQQIRWRWDNDDPFGANMANENPSGLGTAALYLRYPGQYFDRETNDHYNLYRDYSPDIGRYVESDPIGLEGGLNTYAYVKASPLTAVDPLGLYKCIYSVPQHFMVCTPDNPANPPFVSDKWVAGNNVGQGNANCQNSPQCRDRSNVGPPPDGLYAIGPKKLTSSRRNLTPDPRNNMFGRSAFQTHGCDDPFTCSNGCIAATDNATRDTWNRSMDLESNNVIYIQGF
jgi:RHS repeat-associated protein